jgi:hypothetical protein
MRGSSPMYASQYPALTSFWRTSFGRCAGGPLRDQGASEVLLALLVRLKLLMSNMA